jgi:hypothetical protein
MTYQIVGFKRPSEVDPSVEQPKSAYKVILFSRLDEVEFIVNIVEEEEL